MFKLKLFAVAAFLGFAACALLFSSGKTRAQTGETAQKRDELLEKVAGYKNWKRVQKPEKKSELSVSTEAALTTNTFAISDSTLAG